MGLEITEKNLSKIHMFSSSNSVEKSLNAIFCSSKVAAKFSSQKIFLKRKRSKLYFLNNLKVWNGQNEL
jgi:hypothetical protein